MGEDAKMGSHQKKTEEETGFWRRWHKRHRARRHTPHEMREMWRSHFRDYFGMAPEDHWFFGGRRFKGWASSKPETFNPLVGQMLAKGGGLLPLLVLHIVQGQPRYGNEIMKTLQEQTNGRWISNPGVIYPMLSFMEDRGLIEGEWEDEDRRTRRFYHITQRGNEELARLKDVMKPRLEEASEILQSLLDELYAT
jgi:PadR family transcriptional regulator PadR